MPEGYIYVLTLRGHELKPKPGSRPGITWLEERDQRERAARAAAVPAKQEEGK